MRRKEAASPEQIQKAKDFFQAFGVAVKNVALYRHQASGFARFLSPAMRALSEFHRDFGSLTVRVKPFDFFMSGESVFHDDGKLENMIYKIYREGIRTLTFGVGMTIDGLYTFIDLVLKTPRKLGSVELNSLLWKEQIPHFAYLMLEGFQDDDGEEEEEELDEIVDYLRRRIYSVGRDSINFRGLSQEDINLHQTLATAEDQRALRIGVRPLSDEEIDAINELLEDEQEVLPLKATELILMLLTQFDRPEEIEQLEEIILPVAENLLLIHDFHALCFLVEDMLYVGEEIHPSARDAFERLQDNLLRQLATPERLNPVLDILNKTNLTEDMQYEIQAYLILLGEAVHDALLDRLPALTSAARRIIFDTLLRQKQGGKFVQGIIKRYMDETMILIDFIAAGKMIPGTFDLPTLKAFVASSVPMVRMEGLLALHAQYPEKAIIAAHQLLYENHPATHRAAIEVLGKAGADGVATLMEYVRSPDFRKLSDKDQESVFRELGRTQSRYVFAWFLDILSQKSNIFKTLLRSSIDRQKFLAIEGLIASENLKAIQIIEYALEKSKHSKFITETLQKAIHALQFKAKREWEK